MKKEVQLIKKSNGECCFVAIDEFFERETYSNTEPKICEIINQKPYGWWIYVKTNCGCASDFLGDEHIVREFTGNDAENILNNGGKCWVEVDHNNKLEVPMNLKREGKIVFFLNEN